MTFLDRARPSTAAGRRADAPASTIKVLAVVDMCLDVLENWRLGEFLATYGAFEAAHGGNRGRDAGDALSDAIDAWSPELFGDFRGAVDGLCGLCRFDGYCDGSFDAILRDLMMYPCDDVMARAFALRRRLARVRVELVDNAERALVLASPALDVDAGAPFADLEGLKRKVSSLRHYVDSHEVWAFGAREPGAADPFDDAVALLGAFGAFCDRSSKNRTLIWSLGLADVLSELVNGFDVDMGTVGEALRLRELVDLAYDGLAKLLQGERDDAAAKAAAHASALFPGLADGIGELWRLVGAAAGAAPAPAGSPPRADAPRRYSAVVRQKMADECVCDRTSFSCLAGDLPRIEATAARIGRLMRALLAAAPERTLARVDDGLLDVLAACVADAGAAKASEELKFAAADLLRCFLDAGDDEGDARASKRSLLEKRTARATARERRCGRALKALDRRRGDRTLADVAAAGSPAVATTLVAVFAACVTEATVDAARAILPLDALLREAARARAAAGGDGRAWALLGAYGRAAASTLRASTALVPARDFQAYEAIAAALDVDGDAAGGHAAALGDAAAALRDELRTNHRELKERSRSERRRRSGRSSRAAVAAADGDDDSDSDDGAPAAPDAPAAPTLAERRASRLDARWVASADRMDALRGGGPAADGGAADVIRDASTRGRGERSARLLRFCVANAAVPPSRPTVHTALALMTATLGRVVDLYDGAFLCANQPVSWDVGAKLENSLARSNRSRFG